MIDGHFKILVVDDEPDVEPLILQRMRRAIRSGRYDFVFARDGVQALERLNADQGIDMVLSDINMPKMDGLALLEQLPKVDPNLRCVIISAYGDMRNIRTAMNRGAFDFVTKPIDFEDLEVTIERTLAHLTEWRAALASRDQLVALQNELDIASKMQQSILPTRFPQGADFQLYGNMEPARTVGGDFFDVVRLSDNKIGLAIADVSDKGVPAALFMMSSRTLLKGSAIGRSEPGEVLSEVNELLFRDNEAMMFVTMLYAIYNPENGQLTYANGGHNPPLVVHADGSSTVLPLTGGVALGVRPGLDYQQNTVATQPGDTFLLYTDGVTEAMNGSGEAFGLDRLRRVFSASPPKDPESATRAIFETVSAFSSDSPQSDDITCLTLHRSAGSS